MAGARKAAALSAGILMFREDAGGIAVLLMLPGGPFWRNRDDGAWQIPKGLVEPGEDAAETARREFGEEMGRRPEGPLLPLDIIRQAGGKRVQAFALRGEFDPEGLRSNMFELEWPPRSGRVQSYPEVARAAWFPLADARTKMLPSQQPLLDRLEALLDRGI